jgi:hypothetical protein
VVGHDLGDGLPETIGPVCRGICGEDGICRESRCPASLQAGLDDNPYLVLVSLPAPVKATAPLAAEDVARHDGDGEGHSVLLSDGGEVVLFVVYPLPE